MLENKDLYSQIVDAAPHSMIVVNEKGIIILTNRKTEHVFGYNKNDLIGKSIEILVPKRFYENHSNYLDDFSLNPQKQSMGLGQDLYGMHKDGREIPIEIGLNSLDTHGERLLLASIIDISEKKLAEERFKKILEASPNAVIIADISGNIVLANQQIEKTFGYKKEELLGKRIEILIPTRFHSNHSNYLKKYFVKPELRAMGAGRDLFGLHKDGQEIPIEIGLNPIELPDGLFVVASIINITERKISEAKVLQVNIELEAKNSEIEQFIFTVSHDLKSPIVSILGLLGLLQEDLEENNLIEIQKSMSGIKKSANHMSQLIDDLLELSRIGKIPMRPTEVDLDDAIEEVYQANLTSLKERNIEFKFSKQQGRLNFDRLRFIQLIDNLVGNAIKYGSNNQGAIITVGYQFNSKECQLFVKDNGAGIAIEYQKKIFDLFQRLDSNQKGTGVGLTIVKRISELNGGRVWVESEPNKGAAFWIAIPILKSELKNT